MHVDALRLSAGVLVVGWMGSLQYTYVCTRSYNSIISNNSETWETLNQLWPGGIKKRITNVFSLIKNRTHNSRDQRTSVLMNERSSIRYALSKILTIIKILIMIIHFVNNNDSNLTKRVVLKFLAENPHRFIWFYIKEEIN